MKHRRIHVLAIVATMAILPGCTTYTLAQPTEPPIAAFGPGSTKAATVCVIRPSHWALTATFVIHDGTQLVGATKGESYFCYLAEPGPHRIVASRGDTASEDFGQAGLHAEAGHRYWLHLDFDGDFGTQLEWVDEDKARPMIERCDYKELVDAPDGEEAPQGVPYARAQPSPRLIW
jgi:hypothetical protein